MTTSVKPQAEDRSDSGTSFRSQDSGLSSQYSKFKILSLIAEYWLLVWPGYSQLTRCPKLFFKFLFYRSLFCRITGTFCFMTWDDSAAHEFQCQSGFIIACTILSGYQNRTLNPESLTCEVSTISLCQPSPAWNFMPEIGQFIFFSANLECSIWVLRLGV